MYYLYILECSDKTLYTGITTDIFRRVTEHNILKAGAKYTKGRRPVSPVYIKRYRDRSAASKAEASLKKMTREQKYTLIKASPMKWYKKQLEKLEQAKSTNKPVASPTGLNKLVARKSVRSPVAESKLRRPKTDVR